MIQHISKATHYTGTAVSSDTTLTFFTLKEACNSFLEKSGLCTFDGFQTKSLFKLELLQNMNR